MYAKLSQIYWFYLINMIDMTTNYSVILRNMSKQYFNLLLIVMGFVLCSNQCNNCVHPKICKLYNRTSDTIYVGGYWAVSSEELDTFNPKYIFVMQNGSSLEKISPGGSYSLWFPYWDDYKTADENRSFLNQLLIKFIVYNKSTFESYSIDEIVSNNIVDYQYMMSYSDIKNDAFEINFSGI